jgi:hypothetical protein
MPRRVRRCPICLLQYAICHSAAPRRSLTVDHLMCRHEEDTAVCEEGTVAEEQWAHLLRFLRSSTALRRMREAVTMIRRAGNVGLAKSIRPALVVVDVRVLRQGFRVPHGISPMRASLGTLGWRPCRSHQFPSPCRTMYAKCALFCQHALADAYMESWAVSGRLG